MTYSVNDVLNWTAGGSHLTESYVSNPGRTTALEFPYAGNQASSMNNTTITLSTTITNLLTGSFLTGIQMSYETKWSNTGTPITQTWAYSLNGGAFTNFMVNSISGNAWQTNSASFTGLQLQNGDTFVLRDTLTGASGNGQSLDFDDFMISSAGFTPVPEPSGVALLLTAGVAGLVVFRRTKPGQLH
jgi:hypothetical protein